VKLSEAVVPCQSSASGVARWNSARALGTRRFQRAVMGKDILIEIRRLEGASPAQGGYRLQSSASGPESAKGLQWIFHPRLRAGSDAYPGSFH
jgi:hypothetical protein